MARRRNPGTANGPLTNPSRNSPPGSSIRSPVWPWNSTSSKGRAAHEESSSSRRAQACRRGAVLAESGESGDGTSSSTRSPSPSRLTREMMNSRSSQTFSNKSVESPFTECVSRKRSRPALLPCLKRLSGRFASDTRCGCLVLRQTRRRRVPGLQSHLFNSRDQGGRFYAQEFRRSIGTLDLPTCLLQDHPEVLAFAALNFRFG